MKTTSSKLLCWVLICCTFAACSRTADIMSMDSAHEAPVRSSIESPPITAHVSNKVEPVPFSRRGGSNTHEIAQRHYDKAPIGNGVFKIFHTDTISNIAVRQIVFNEKSQMAYAIDHERVYVLDGNQVVATLDPYLKFKGAIDEESIIDRASRHGNYPNVSGAGFRNLVRETDSDYVHLFSHNGIITFIKGRKIAGFFDIGGEIDQWSLSKSGRLFVVARPTPYEMRVGKRTRVLEFEGARLVSEYELPESIKFTKAVIADASRHYIYVVSWYHEIAIISLEDQGITLLPVGYKHSKATLSDDGRLFVAATNEARTASTLYMLRDGQVLDSYEVLPPGSTMYGTTQVSYMEHVGETDELVLLTYPQVHLRVFDVSSNSIELAGSVNLSAAIIDFQLPDWNEPLRNLPSLGLLFHDQMRQRFLMFSENYRTLIVTSSTDIITIIDTKRARSAAFNPRTEQLYMAMDGHIEIWDVHQ